MDCIASAIDRVKGLANSAQERIRAASQKEAEDAHRNDPIEILKRLQREAFSDLMKLRDRQDKLEKVLSLYATSKGNPFQEAATRMRGVVDVIGACFFADANGQQTSDTLSKAGIRTGINSRFIFETTVRQKDELRAELVASNKTLSYDGYHPWSPLALTKVSYVANINDWLSVITTPMGAQCKDFSSAQGQRLPDISWSGPPLFGDFYGCGAGLNVKGSDFTATLAQMIPELNLNSDSAGSCLATYGQLNYQPLEGTRISLSGLWQIPRSPFQQIKLGPLAIPLFGPNKRSSDAFVRQSSGVMRKPRDTVSEGSFTLLLDSDLDDRTKVAGWVQMQKKHPNDLQWAISFSDIPNDDLGWGLSVASVEGHARQVCLEGFLNFNLGKRFNLQPGLAHVMNCGSEKPVLMLRSSWSF